MTEVSPQPTDRTELLKKVFLEFAGEAPRSPEARLYANDGNGERNILSELAYLRPLNQLDAQIESARTAYMNVVLQKPNILNRKKRKINLHATEDRYETTVVDKLKAYTTSDGTPQAALELGQLPGIIHKASFAINKELALRDLAANHLHLTMDTLLQEHAARRQIIQERHDESLLNRIRSSRGLHLGVAGVIFFAAFAPEATTIPVLDKDIVADITLGLKIATAFVFTVDGPEVLRLWALDIAHTIRTKKLNKELADSQEETDLALRIVYGSPHYGSSKGFLAHSNRSGTEDPEMNAKILASTDKQIDGMHGDPGGRPYTGREALGYAARFLQERHDQLVAITNEPDIAKRKDLYVELVKEVLQQDLDRMKKGITVSRVRKTVMKGIAAVVSPLLPDGLNKASDMFSTTQDVTDLATSRSKKKDEES